MTTDAATVARSVTGPKRPYAPSWADRLIAWFEGLPVPFWVPLAGLAVGIIAIQTAVVLLAGHDLAVSGPRFFLLGLIPSYSIAMLRHLAGLAGRGARRFRPLLGMADDEFEELRYRLTVIPAVPAVVASVSIIPGTIFSVFNAPAVFEIAGAPPLAIAGIFIVAVVVGAFYTTLLLQIIRQLFLVDRIHRAATSINLFDQAPLHAFSPFTAQASLALILLAVVLGLTTGPQAASSGQFALGVLGLYGSFVVIGIATFILPLYSLRRRIAAEKERLQTEADARLTGLLDALHDDAARLDLSRADGLNKLIGSALQERDMLAKLPTWPWQATTLRGFVSALLLPVVVYVLARATERVVL